jgi:hypothetical protein
MPGNEKAILVWEYEGGATRVEAQLDRGGRAERRAAPEGKRSGSATAIIAYRFRAEAAERDPLYPVPRYSAGASRGRALTAA